jgi:DNA-binding beta-propeller fold protein YncE
MDRPSRRRRTLRWALLRFCPIGRRRRRRAHESGGRGIGHPGAQTLIHKAAEPNQAPHGTAAAARRPLDGEGRLWIADFGTSKLHVFDPDGGFLGGWGGNGNGERRFNHPYGVAIAGDTVYVADTENSRVTAFSLAGDFKATSGGLYGPRGIAVAPDGSIWVTDLGNRRLMRYDAQLKHWDSFGHSEKGLDFRAPIGIAVAPDGVVYVSDPDDHSLKIVDRRGTRRDAGPFRRGTQLRAVPHQRPR